MSTTTPISREPQRTTASKNAVIATESAERLARPLIALAQSNGVATSYIDQLGTYVEIDDDVLVNVLGALGVDATSDEAITRSQRLCDTQNSKRLLSHGTIVSTTDNPAVVTLHCPPDARPDITLTLEDGTERRLSIATLTQCADTTAESVDFRLPLPADLPIGYHTLHVEAGERTSDATLMVAPPRIPLPDALERHPRWGWMAQLYSVRSHESWGVGDYGDLKRLAADAAVKSGADFMLINPIHAGAPIPPLEPSPYLPESRRFLNVTYIRPQDIEEYARLDAADRSAVDALHDAVAARNDDPSPMDLNESWSAKRRALRIIFKQQRTPEREAAFDRFVAHAGPDLDAFAAWCVAFEVWGAPWEHSWFDRTGRESPEVGTLIAEHRDLFTFHRWLQWIADEQVTAAQTAAKESGMAVGLIQDMAVGVHALGADVWWSPERFAVGSVTVGCPPDFYNQQGQDWGQPPLNPRYLDRTGYQVYREMVHAMFAHAGAVRIDHVLGLFRLWWIPRGKGAKGGAYVMYDHEAMLAVLAIEATRANGIVIGEDLGTVPDYVRRILADHGVLGTDVAWFARVDDSPNAGDPYKPPTAYRRQALASVTTHDLPPTAGYLEFEHVRLREQLHLLDEPVETFAASALAERQAMLDMLVAGGWLDAAAAADVPGHVQHIVEAMHAMLADTPSVLRQAALVDGTGQHRTVNQPGTSDQYPNWRIPLLDANDHVVHTDEVFDNPRVLALARVMRER